MEARKLGVVCKPDVAVRRIQNSHDKYLVLATDGLWSVMEAIEVVSLMERSLVPGTAGSTSKEKGNSSQNVSGTREDKKLSLPKETNVAKMLAAHAKYRWMSLAAAHPVKVDDITVVVVLVA